MWYSAEEKPLEKVLSWAENLQTNLSPDGRFYYKPLVLSALLDLLDREPEHENSFTYGELWGGFRKLSAGLGSEVSEDQFSQPYVRMKNDTKPLQVWVPDAEDAQDIDDSKSDQPSLVRKAIPSIHIEDSAWPVFRSKKGREAIRETIQNRWSPPMKPTKTLEQLAEELLLDRKELARIRELLEAKKQVIFYGPPGTGKTFVARKLAGFLAGSEGSVETVQFHASYAYEDFVEGYRPSLVEGQPGFKLVPGPLKRIAAKARENPEATYVLVIDELNRSNVAKVFGELYYLLEYRDEKITLQYSPDQQFALPNNLWIIGTMNTADRSIALVDAALRRRFYFVPFFPDEPPIQGLLQRWLERHKPDLLWVAAVVDEANKRLDDRHIAIGPSYFMTPNLTEDWVDIVWKHQIAPYLEEQFFGERDRLREFELTKLRETVGRRPTAE